MGSTFGGLEIGKRSLNAHQVALGTIGHNLSNASVEGYSRQRVNMKAMDPLYRPDLVRENVPGQIGQGVEVSSIQRIRDQFLEKRIIAQNPLMGYWRTRDNYLLQVDKVYQEPYDTSVRNLMDRFWEGWQVLSQNPGGDPERQVVLRRGEALMNGINRRYDSLKQIRTMLDDDLATSVGEVNAMLSEIKNLNLEIVKSEAVGDNPNDLYDRRDLLVNKISDYLPAVTDNRDPDEFQLHVGGLHLIQGKQVSFLEAVPNPENEGLSDIVWAANGERLALPSGKLGALVEVRDVDVRGEIQALDEMTLAFADLVNAIHRQGWSDTGSTGQDFFREYPFVDNLSGNYDRTGDGELDSTYVYRMTGVNTLNMESPVGFAGIMTFDGPEGPVDVPYTAMDTVGAILDRINNSPAELTARLNRDGRLELRAGISEPGNPDFVIRHVEDSGQFLVGYAGLLTGSGQAAAYDWGGPDAVLALRPDGSAFSVAPLTHPSAWMQVNPTIVSDPSQIASGLSDTGQQPAAGDNRAAAAIAQLRHRPVLTGRSATFDDWFALSAADIGLKGEIAEQTSLSQELVMQDLEELRQAVSGVNLDEEFSEMIKFQHGYNAAARFVSTVNQMLEVIINRMGV